MPSLSTELRAAQIPPGLPVEREEPGGWVILGSNPQVAAAALRDTAVTAALVVTATRHERITLGSKAPLEQTAAAVVGWGPEWALLREWVVASASLAISPVAAAVSLGHQVVLPVVLLVLVFIMEAAAGGMDLLGPDWGFLA